MIDVIKIQIDILKNVSKMGTKSYVKMAIGHNADKTVYGYGDNGKMYFVTPDENFIDVENLCFRTNTTMMKIDPFVVPEYDSKLVDIYIQPETRELQGNILRKFSDDKNYTVYINDTFLKYNKKDFEPEFRLLLNQNRPWISPVLQYDGRLKICEAYYMPVVVR